MPFLLAFNNLNYDVWRKGYFDENSTHDVSSEVFYGDILVVFGAREVGKSMLVGRMNTLRGTITLDGEKVLKTQLLKVISAYIMQDDILFPMLTVKETLTLQKKTWTKIPTKCNSSEIN